jgi:hypothetical protein
MLWNLPKDTKQPLHPENPNIGIGRGSTTKIALNQIAGDGLFTIIFGYGPGTLTPKPFGTSKVIDRRVQNISGGYGITGMVHILIEYGLIGVTLFILILVNFFRWCWQWFNREKDKYWKAFSTGTIVFCSLNLLIFLTYNILPIADETLLPVFYYAMSVVHMRCNCQNEKAMSTVKEFSHVRI